MVSPTHARSTTFRPPESPSSNHRPQNAIVHHNRVEVAVFNQQTEQVWACPVLFKSLFAL